MTGFDYGNARVRAMKTWLMPGRDLENLAAIESLPGLIAALTHTAYRKPIEGALASLEGLDCISTALRNDLVNTLGKIRCFYQNHAGDLVAISLRRFDVHNLKAVLRGLARHLSPGEILLTVLPVGDIHNELLSDLARASTAREAIDLLASMRLAIAQPLMRLRSERPGTGVPEMELALERWYYQDAKRILASLSGESIVLAAALDMELDLTNLLTVFRFVNAPAEWKSLREWVGSNDLRILLLGPGKIGFDLLVRTGEQDSLDAAVETLAGTSFAPALRDGLAAYHQTFRLSDIEKSLRRFRLQWMKGLIPKDSLGMGLVLGYISLKTNEIDNIRWIAQAIHLGLKTDEIQANLAFTV